MGPAMIDPAQGSRSTGGARLVRVGAVVPCFQRQDELDQILADLHASLRTGDRLEVLLRVVVVDNCSATPLHAAGFPGANLIRLPSNRGGSGGFNAGMRAQLEDWDPDYLWLLDSDARVEPTTMLRLVERMERRPDLVALGPALAEPGTGVIHEIGGSIHPKTGLCGRAAISPQPGDEREVILCDYAASCCLLVRASGVRATGLMPEAFVNGDDTEWCVRLSERTALNIAADPSVRAFHPRFDRFPTWQRYYHSRNGFGAMAALKLGRKARLRRALHETARGVNQALMGRKDLARLHIRGLADAAFTDATGPAPERATRFDRPRPIVQLREALGPGEIAPSGGVYWHPAVTATPEERESIRLALGLRHEDARPSTEASGRGAWRALARRVLFGPGFAVAIVPSKGGPSAWFTGRTQVQVSEGGFVIRRVSRWSALRAAARIGARGVWYAAIIGASRGRSRRLAEAPNRPHDLPAAARADGPEVSLVVVSYNRRATLLETLGTLTREHPDAELIVVDNASHDGSAGAARERFPRARVIELPRNLGVAAFNRGVEAADGEIVVVLDDDATPEPDVLGMAVRMLRSRGDLGAIPLLPRHPDSGVPEWPSGAASNRRTDRWPMMGCANVVRRRDWLLAGGYEPAFFLYRNDTDLALKLLGSGSGVHFNPAWCAWHDSPAAARKSARWLDFATRNWLWMCRRHGRGLRKYAVMLLGVVWGARLAGASRSRLKALARGAWRGVAQPFPRLPRTVRPTGDDLWSLAVLQLSSRAKGRARPTPESAAPAMGLPAAASSSPSSGAHSA